MKIIKNAIKCKLCGEVIESKSVHDFVPCKCFRESGGSQGCAVDGGHEYLRRCGFRDNIEELSIICNSTGEEVLVHD